MSPLECIKCPLGADCSVKGLTLQTLSLRPGYYRTADDSADVRVCPDYRPGADELGLFSSNDSTSCVGGEMTPACADNVTGVYCTRCDNATMAAGGFHFDLELRRCVACEFRLPPVVYFIIVLLVLAGASALALRYAGARAQQLGRQAVVSVRAWFHRSRRQYKLYGKLLIGFYQIVSEIEAVFLLRLPLRVAALLNPLGWLKLEPSSFISLECIGAGGYTNKLRASAVAPLLLVLIAFVHALGREAHASRRLRGLLQRSALRVLPTALFITFLVVPSVSLLAFQAFRCECFENGESYLRADYSLQCTTGGSCLDTDTAGNATTTAEYDDATSAAWAVIWLYAVGVPCLYAVLLFAARRAIKQQEPTPLSAALSFLHEDYNVQHYWWELAVVGRKLMVVGFATLIFPGTLMQLVVVLLFVLAYMLVLVKSRPYTRKSVTTLAEVEQFSLCVVVALCVLIKVEQLASQLDRYLTAELRARFVFDSDVVSDMMLAALLASAVMAAFFSLRRLATAACRAFDATLAAKGDAEAADDDEEVDDGAAAAAARAEARAHLRAVLDADVFARGAGDPVRERRGDQPDDGPADGRGEGRGRARAPARGRAPRARECARRRERARRGHGAAG